MVIGKESLALATDTSFMTDAHIMRAIAGNTLEAMVTAYRVDHGGTGSGPPDVAEVSEVAHALQHLAEHEACGVKTLCWVLADALARLAKGKR